MTSRVVPFVLVMVLGSLVTTAVAGDYESSPAAAAVIDAAVARGVDRDWAEAVVGEAQKQQSILDAISRPAEKTKAWRDYRKIFVTPERARAGVDFAKTHGKILTDVAKRTGVPSEVIVAIIGVETYYGRIAGSYRVIDALATLAFDYPKRAPFFTGELEHFLVLAYQAGKDPLALKGSYAGAMGYGQFMPSSYNHYAVDHDGDGIADIWDNPADAIYSVANYFLEHGWRAGQPVVVPAVGASAEPAMFDGKLKPERTVGELANLGFAPQQPIDIDAKATAMRLEGDAGNEYWLGLHNFYVITRYNHSAMYALSVWQLSQLIAEGMAGA